MKTANEVKMLTQSHLLQLLEDVYKKGSESADVNSKQLVDEIAMLLKPYVKTEQ